MRAVLVETHGLGGPSINLRASAFDLRIPCGGGICIRLPVETTKELECEPCALLRRKPKDLGEHVWGLAEV